MATENTQMQARPAGGPPSPAQNIKGLIEAAKPKLAEVMPRHLTPERLTRVAIACITRTPKLLQCSPASLLQAVMQAAELGLEPGSALGEAYLVPYGQTCQLIPGYRGLIALARRSGQIEDIEATVVREGDIFEFDKGSDQRLVHKPDLDGAEVAPLRLVYAMAWLKGCSRPHIEVMRKAEIDKVRARSKSATSGPWVTDYEEMARKTVVRRLVKYLPMSVEMAKAFDRDLEEEGVLDVVPTEAPQLGAKDGGFKGRVLGAAKQTEEPYDWGAAAGEAEAADREVGADDDK